MRVVKNLGYRLKFKDENKNSSNLHIETYFNKIDNNYIVEFWDVTKNYHSFKLFEHEIEDLKSLLKTLDKDTERYKKIKDIISFNEKYNNKRKLVPIDEFDNIFYITDYTQQVVWQTLEGYLKYNNEQSITCDSMSIEECFNRIRKGTTGYLHLKYK